MTEARPPVLQVLRPNAAAEVIDPEVPYVVFFGADVALVRMATNALGLGFTIVEGRARVPGSQDDLRRLAVELRTRGAGCAEALERFIEPVTAWRLRTKTLPLDRPQIMGIVNLTDDSFSGDGVGQDTGAALTRAQALRAAGATIIDVGGESARAGRPVVEPETEAAYVGPAIEAMTREGHCVSVDTYKPVVAKAAIAAGAEIVNDISGLTIGTGAAEVAAKAGAGYVLNYSYAPPKVRPDHVPQYTDVVAETLVWMEERVATLRALGIADERLAIDPGIAFGKSHDEDIEVLRRLGELQTPGLPLLIAHSRKNYIGSVTGAAPDDRDLETHLSTAMAWAAGARIFRVHDVAGARRALAMAEALTTAGRGSFAPDAESWPWAAGADAGHAVGAETVVDAPAGQRW